MRPPLAPKAEQREAFSTPASLLQHSTDMFGFATVCRQKRSKDLSMMAHSTASVMTASAPHQVQTQIRRKEHSRARPSTSIQTHARIRDAPMDAPRRILHAASAQQRPQVSSPKACNLSPCMAAPVCPALCALCARFVCATLVRRKARLEELRGLAMGLAACGRRQAAHAVSPPRPRGCVCSS